jgi:hypothetical protein
MKKLFKNISQISLIAFLGMASLAYAQSPVAMVNGVTGRAFLSKDGATKELRQGMLIEDFSDLVTEEGASVSLSDYYDHRFHIAGASQVKFLNKIIELRNGYLWVQSGGKHTGFTVQTANALIAYDTDEFVASFEPMNGKSQVLVMKGDVEFANLQDLRAFVSITEGKFSFVMNSVDESSPRSPTEVGYASFQKIAGMFGGLSPLKDAPTQTIQRNVASVPEQTAKSGEIIYIRAETKKSEATRASELEQLHKSKVTEMVSKIPSKKKYQSKYTKPSGVTVRVFGLSPRATAKVKSKPAPIIQAPRAPASVPEKAINTSNAFESGLIDEYKRQKRHSKEMNNLIDKLQSVDMDYTKSY